MAPGAEMPESLCVPAASQWLDAPEEECGVSLATSRSLRLAIQAGAGIHVNVIANLDDAEMSVRLVCSLNHSKIRVEL
jgi:hypothetical protein